MIGPVVVPVTDYEDKNVSLVINDERLKKRRIVNLRQTDLSLDIGSITRENCNTPEQMEDTNDERKLSSIVSNADDDKVIVIVKTSTPVPPLKVLADVPPEAEDPEMLELIKNLTCRDTHRSGEADYLITPRNITPALHAELTKKATRKPVGPSQKGQRDSYSPSSAKKERLDLKNGPNFRIMTKTSDPQ